MEIGLLNRGVSMGLHGMAGDSESRFEAYVEDLCRTVRHADRAAPLRAYCLGLMLPGDRKSVEPMAARVEPGRVQAAHQSMHHFVAKADWSDEAMLAAVRGTVLPAITRHGRVRAWIIDDTGLPKKGVHSVGVARQYCGQLGKQDNCQVAVTLSIASDHASLPIAYRLYLPEDWASDPVRRQKAGVPDDVIFTQAVFQGRAGDADAIAAEMADIKSKREASHKRICFRLVEQLNGLLLTLRDTQAHKFSDKIQAKLKPSE